MAPGELPWPFYFQETIMRRFNAWRKRFTEPLKCHSAPRQLAQIRSDQTIKREFFGTWAIKNAIWSDKMRRFRKMKSSHKLGM
jgi:hypothetical protein